VNDTQRIIASLQVRAPIGGAISLLPNFRAGGPGSRSQPEFKRGDRAWFGAAIAELPDLSAIQLTARWTRPIADGCRSAAESGCASMPCRTAT
jgi:hypothetical protein